MWRKIAERAACSVRIRIPKKDHGSAIFKSCTVLLLPTESVKTMALLTHFFATRLQCYRSTFATAATAARHRCRVRTGCDGDDENRRPREGSGRDVAVSRT